MRRAKGHKQANSQASGNTKAHPHNEERKKTVKIQNE